MTRPCLVLIRGGRADRPEPPVAFLARYLEATTTPEGNAQ